MKTPKEEVIKPAAITAIILGIGAVLYGLWIGPAVSSFSSERAKRKTIAPLINEAKSLKISYDSALSSPDQTTGKPVIWCIQNRGENAVTYEGNPNKRIIPSPEGDMPLFYGSKHSTCENMLLIIQGVQRDSTVSGSAPTLIKAQYISQVQS